MNAHYALVYCIKYLKVRIQHFTFSKQPVWVVYQGKSLGHENLISSPPALILVKKVLWASPARLMAIRHAIGKLSLPFRALYQPQDPAAYAANLPAVVRDAMIFQLSNGSAALAASPRTCLLHHSTSFGSSTFFSIFITPLIYRLKSQKSGFRQIIFFFFFDEVMLNLNFLLECLESLYWVFFVLALLLQ